MANELLFPISALIVITVWLAIKHAVGLAQQHRQLEIARRGASCQGKVVGIQRPFMLDACTRLYFDFVPQGGAQPLRACHVERRPFDELRGSLPAAGTVVTIRYLPEQPTHAVISKLVAPAQAA
ncbi:MAG TPA: DUF3592 domain-containing protein [Steroidobacter sp.]|jgi:hypothetical protein|nr:DUF3592 domain-containing protein [Steroidobacter sp.]